MIWLFFSLAYEKKIKVKDARDLELFRDLGLFI